MEASLLAGILLILSTAYIHTTRAQEQPQVPRSLGKYFIYVNCTDCEVDSDLVVKEGEEKKNSDSSESLVTDETISTTETTETTKKSATAKKPMSDNDKNGDCKKKKDEDKGRDRLPKRPKGPKPGPSGQRKKPKRPSTKGNFNEYPSRTEEYVNPYLPKDKQDSGKDSGFEYSFYEVPSDEDSRSEDSFYDDTNSKKLWPEYPIIEDTESPSEKARTEEYINPYLPKDQQEPSKGSDGDSVHVDPDLLSWLENLFSEFPSENSRTEEYVNPYLPKDKQDSNEGSYKRYTLPFKEYPDKASSDEYANSYLPKDKQDSNEGSYKRYTLPFTEYPNKASSDEYANPYLPKDKQDSNEGSYKRYTLPFTEYPNKASSDDKGSGIGYTLLMKSYPNKDQTGEYVNPFLSEDKQDFGYDYDDGENPDIQHFKKLIMEKYENSVFRYADLQRIPDEKRMYEDKVCVHETVNEAGQIIETLDYSLQKPCRILSSPANKDNMIPLWCRPYSKSRVCLMRVKCAPPSIIKSKADCVQHFIIRKQNVKSKDEKNSENRFKRQDPGYKSETGAMDLKINNGTVTKK